MPWHDAGLLTQAGVGATNTPAPKATAANRENLVEGITLPGKGFPVWGSIGMQGRGVEAAYAVVQSVDPKAGNPVAEKSPPISAAVGTMAV